jgi:protein-S-isoprenylcysteine O-methyltransferase Ste14
LDRSDETRRGVTRWLIKEPMGVVFVAVSLFVPAGRWDWGWGWAMVALYAAWVGATTLLLIRRSPELLAERAARRKGGKGWDMALMSIVGLLTVGKHIVAGLDVRWGGAQMPLAPHLIGLVVAGLGYALGVWAMVANAFFSKIVRIQEDRSHTVVSGGPYRVVRHPGYLGTVAFELSTPFLLGSWWALIPGALAALLMVVRTALEDRTLQAELNGYAEYSRKVRHRLLPGVW